MSRAHYMVFSRDHAGSLDRVGGLPSHLPLSLPRCAGADACGQEMAFLAQFYSCTERNYGSVLCLQLYQCPMAGDGGDPMPVVVEVPPDAAPNSSNLGSLCKRIIPHDVHWEERADPDKIDLKSKACFAYMPSKAFGTPFHGDLVEAGEQLILQLQERPADFNFGGLTLLVVRDCNGKLGVRLG